MCIGIIPKYRVVVATIITFRERGKQGVYTEQPSLEQTSIVSTFRYLRIKSNICTKSFSVRKLNTSVVSSEDASTFRGNIDTSYRHCPILPTGNHKRLRCFVHLKYRKCNNLSYYSGLRFASTHSCRSPSGLLLHPDCIARGAAGVLGKQLGSVYLEVPE